MSQITVKLLGDFSVFLDEKRILFQYKKVEALFIYMIIKKHATRDELSNILWSDKEEGIAKKNLRNAIYTLKKSFAGSQELLIVENAVISINPEIAISTDVEYFLKDASEIESYQGDFLRNYEIKAADAYESWVIEVRESLKKTYLERLRKAIEIEEKNGNFDKVEKYCELVIENDEFDENTYRILMKCYKNQGKFSKSLKLYDQLSELLEKELSITPELETEKVLADILKEVNPSQINQKKNVFFFGREKELDLINDNCKKFIRGLGGQSLLIKGEMGVGKTYLKEKLINQYFCDEDIFVIETICYQFEKAHAMKSWKNIMVQLLKLMKKERITIPASTYKIFSVYHSETEPTMDLLDDINIEGRMDLLRCDIVEDLIMIFLKIMSAKKKMLFVFEDIHWMDEDSLFILIRVLTRINREKIMFVITSRNEQIKTIEMLSSFANEKRGLKEIILERYTKKEVEEFMHQALPGTVIAKDILNKIYMETEGNAFFLTEYLQVIDQKKNINIMTANMHNIIDKKFYDMSKEEKKITEITALFDDGVPLFMYTELLKIDELEILDVLENLEHRRILEEISSPEASYFKFTHRKLREYKYNSLSPARKTVLHNKVAEILEEQLKRNPRNIDLLYQIVYHYENANNMIGYLKFKIKILNIYLDFSHERFPVLHFENIIYNQFNFDENLTKEKIREIVEILDKIKNTKNESPEVLALEMAILHIEGRYMIRRGVYEEGLQSIKSMMEIAEETGNRTYLIEGCKQIILYCIQKNNTEMMNKYIRYGLELLEVEKNEVNRGIFLRYRAIYEIMTGNIENAEMYLNEGVNALQAPMRNRNKNILQIAACYDDMGDIKRRKREYHEALNYYKKAITLCEENNIWISVSLFYTHAGETAYGIGNYDEAREYFEKALLIFNKIEYNAGQAIAEAYMALFYLKEQKYQSAVECLLRADKNANISRSPKEIGTVLYVKSRFKLKMESEIELENLLKSFLELPLNAYVIEGIQVLEAVKEDYLKEVLMKLLSS